MYGHMDVKYNVSPSHNQINLSFFYIVLLFKECNNYTLNDRVAVNVQSLCKSFSHSVSPYVLSSSPSRSYVYDHKFLSTARPLQS